CSLRRKPELSCLAESAPVLIRCKSTGEKADEMVPEAAKETVDGAIDQGAEAGKEGIDKAVEAVAGEGE
ncbi:MAG: hypothetical protein AAGA03_12790, partial [Planctomycetota bacterium]